MCLWLDQVLARACKLEFYKYFKAVNNYCHFLIKDILENRLSLFSEELLNQVSESNLVHLPQPFNQNSIDTVDVDTPKW